MAANTASVKLRGTHVAGRQHDLPTMIWLPELTEPAANFVPFFERKDNKVADVRNVWCLDYRNQGSSDHHESYDMEEMSDDIVRFMDANRITMATIGGHGFGAKVAAATAINHMDRFTGVIQLEGGPLNHQYYEAYQELESYVKHAHSIRLEGADASSVMKQLEQGIPCKKWCSIFKQNLNADGSALSWKINLNALHANMKKHVPDVANWSESYGLWPGQALSIFAANSRWVHLATNTLPFYNVFPRLEGQFPFQISTHADDFHGPLTHWIHEEPSDQVWYLSQKMWRWLQHNDGTNVLLADKTEAGWRYIGDRGWDQNATGEYTPEHVHHNYLYSNVYEQSRKERGVEGANHGEYLARNQWSPRQ